MTVPRDRSRVLAGGVALMAAFGLVLQYAILIDATRQTLGPMLATVRFFSYFTILSNVLVATVTAVATLVPTTAVGHWWNRPVVRGAVALYIGITLAIYATVLSALWQPQGAQWWADSCLHYAVPVAYLLWWWASPHGTLRRSDVGRWLLFPLGYLTWVFARGAWVHEYPYPFLDLTLLPMAMVVRNCAGVFALFLAGGASLVAIDRWQARGPVTVS